MSDLLIRLAAPGEYGALGELREAAYEHDYDISDHYRQRLLDVHANAAEHQVWVATDRHTGQLLGTVIAPRPGGHVSPLGRDGELDFRLLAVVPSARGRGIGRLLVEHETRMVEGHTQPLLAFGYEVADGARL